MSWTSVKKQLTNPVSWICKAVGNRITANVQGIQITQFMMRFGKEILCQNPANERPSNAFVVKSHPIQA